MRTVDPARHEARRRHILAAASGCFARSGFAKTTTAQICTAAGISSGSLFHYFPSKRAVFLAIFADAAEETTQRLAAAAGSADPWGAVLTEMHRQARELADPDAAGLAIEVIAQAGRDEEFASVVVAGDHALRDGLAVLLAEAAAAGQIDRQVPSRTAADWLCGLIDAMYTRSGVDPEFQPLRELPTLRLIMDRFLLAEPREHPDPG